MKTIFEQRIGIRAHIVFDKDWKFEGIVSSVSHECVVIETTLTGADHLVFVPLDKIIRFSFEDAGTP